MRYSLIITSAYGGWKEEHASKRTALRAFEELKSSLVFGEVLRMTNGARTIKEVRR